MPIAAAAASINIWPPAAWLDSNSRMTLMRRRGRGNAMTLC